MPGGKRGQSCTLSPITPSTSPSEYKKRPTAAESRRNNHGENLRKLPQIGNVQAQRQRLPQLAAEKKETPKVTPEEYAAAHVMSRIEWRTKRDSVENADGSKTVLEHHYPVVIVGEGDRRTVCGYYAYLSRDEMRYCAMSDEWKGTTTVVDEYMPHDGGFAIIRAMEEG